MKVTLLDFLENEKLDASVEEYHTKMVEFINEVVRLQDIEGQLNEAECILVAQYNSIDDFEQAKKAYFEGE